MRNAAGAVLCGILGTVACSGAPEAAAQRRAADVDARRLERADRDEGNWLMYGRTYDEQRFSPLELINERNVTELGLAWYLDLGTHRGVEATPLVVDGVLYTTSAWNVTYALDARTGEQLWKFDPKVAPGFGRLACCDVVSRGLAAWRGKILSATLDGRLIALDAASGKIVWSVQTVDPQRPYTVTGAPRVFDGKVLIGNSGAELGVRGYVTAYDADTGAQLWRFYTVPGNPADGFESDAMAMAAKTWSGEWWKFGGGGTAWDSIVYDPELDYVYIGTGNGGPWVQAYRSPGGGDNLFLSSIVAVEADTGRYVWHYQTTPGDQWDYTATQPMMLASLTLGGRERRVLMQAPKNGFYYILDRATGELLSAANFVPINWASHVDLETGRPVVNSIAYYDLDPVLLTPAPNGAHNWHPMSYSPLTGLVYFPVQELWVPYARDPGFDLTTDPPPFRRSSGWGGALGERGRAALAEGATRTKARLIAWDPVRARETWRVEFPRGGNGGTLVTAGNLVFQGNVNQMLAAYRADTGERLWETPVQNMPVAPPITYLAGGEQYVALNAGWGGGQVMQEFRANPARQRADGRLLVFKLGGSLQLPPLDDAPELPPPPPALPAGTTEQTIAEGAALYNRSCALCHGIDAVSAGVIKDLRHMAPEAHAAFDDIVLRGVREAQGMASFADVVTAADATAIHAYLIARANEDWGRTTN